MRTEIASIPAIIRREFGRWAAEAESTRSFAAGRRQWLTVGRGSSGNAATFYAYLATQLTGRAPIDMRPAALASIPPGTYDDSVLLAFSASGRSTDVADVCRALRRAGALTVAIDNAEPDSGEVLLRQVSDRCIPLGAGAEAAVPATRSFVAQLVVGAALAGVDIRSSAEAVADAVERTSATGVAEAIADHLEDARVCVWLGRGSGLAVAEDAALKVTETARRPAFAWSAAEVRHGPIGGLDERDRAVILCASRQWTQSVREGAAALRGRGVSTLVVASAGLGDEVGADLVLTGVPSADEVPWGAGVVFATVAQTVALTLAERAGLDPDAPPGLAKVTLTR